MNTKSKNLGVGWMVFIMILMIAIVILAELWAPKGLNWVIVAGSMLVFVISLGLHICGRPMGILIDERNEMSLSRFQLVTWTLIILSAFVTIALERVFAGVFSPLAIELPWQLWALMGISTTSLVGFPLIKSTKKRKTSTDDSKKKTAKSHDVEEPDIKEISEGILYVKRSIDEAEFSDIFQGEEIANSSQIDLAKVQMFFFTLIAAISYVVILFNWIVTKEPDALGSFPELSEGLIAILAISHAGYLGNKIVDHTKVE